MTTLSEAMDLPLTVLMRAAAVLSGHPELRGAQEAIVAAAQTLEAVRIGVAHMEGRASAPTPATIQPCAVVMLDEVRAVRAGRTARQ